MGVRLPPLALKLMIKIKTNNKPTRSFDNLNYTSESINTIICMFQDSIELDINFTDYIHEFCDIVEKRIHSIYNVHKITRRIEEQIELSLLRE
jgi:hypothetical protein